MSAVLGCGGTQTPAPQAPATTNVDSSPVPNPNPEKINDSIAKNIKGKRKARIAECEERVEAGDTEFRDDLCCVAEADDLDGLIRCDGWTEWPGM